MGNLGAFFFSTNDVFAGKEPWNLNDTAKPIAEEWLRLRHRLFPYLYTMNYKSHTELQPLIQPMYYSHPECDAAYNYRNQYWFGSELIVAPITSKGDEHSLLGSVRTWLPEGRWIDFFNGFVYEGDRELEVHRSLKEFPVFAKAGAIVPIENCEHGNVLGKKENLEIYVFPGADNTFILYEDSGDGCEYKNGGFVTTEMSLKWGQTATFKIKGAKGDTSLIPERRNWRVCFRGFSQKLNICATVSGKEISADFKFDQKTNTTEILIKDVAVVDEIIITVSQSDTLFADNSLAKMRIYDILMYAQMSYAVKYALWESVCRGDKFLYSSCSMEDYSKVLSAVEEMYSLLNH